MLCPKAERRLLGNDDTNDVGCHTEAVHQPSSQQQAASCLAFGFDASNAAGERAGSGPAEQANKKLPPGLQPDPGEIGDGLAAAQLEADRSLALKLDVRATPTIFVNGERVTGHVADAELERVIDAEARTMRWLVAQGIPPAQAYARRVRKNLIGVGLGVDARWCVPEEDAPAEGASAPLLTIVEFSDFECEACRSLEPALTATVARHANVVRRVWRSFALPQHRHAARAAAFALSARELGGDRAFWTVHAALFGARSVELDDEQLRRVAAHLGLDADKLLTLAERAERTTELERDHALAESLGLDGAPTLFMNGRRIAGAPPPEALEGLVREELDIAKRLTKTGADSARIRALLCDD